MTSSPTGHREELVSPLKPAAGASDGEARPGDARAAGKRRRQELIELSWPDKPQEPTLRSASAGTWIGTADRQRTAHPVLHHVRGPEDATNLLIQGDALAALGGLLDHDRYQSAYANSVRLCYIDPPFNTGETFLHYDDKVGSAEWLSALYERLLQIRRVLAPDGSIWLHLDDAEQHRARCVLDEVFGSEAFVATVIWQKRTSRDNRKAFSAMHDYIHVYSPAGPLAWKRTRNPLPDHGAFQNSDNDPRGPWRSAPLSAQAGHGTLAQFYTIASPAGVLHDPPPGRCWTYTRPRFNELVQQGRVYWPRAGAGKPRLKRYQTEAGGLAPFTIWTAEEVGGNADAKKALLTRFPGSPVFDTPKPERLLERIVHIASDPGDLVLDCYLGSGTTAVAAQRTGRRWIGIERSDAVLKQFAIPRLEAELESAGIKPSEGFALLEVAEPGTPAAALRA